MRPKSTRNAKRMNRIIFLVGPTASGKTDVAVDLAKGINAEIISCDSMQVYRGMDILSQKPTQSQCSIIPHHMISILDPRKEFSVAEYKAKVEDVIKKIHNKGKGVLVAGGSGLYVKALIDGLFPSQPKDAKLRTDLLNLSKKYGKKYLHNRLKRIDPKAAASIHPNNTRRVIRGLEVYKTSGVTISQMKSKTRGLSGRYDIRIFGLNRIRQKLYDRIDKRVDKMFVDGLVAEVHALTKKRISRTAKSALGYKEVADYINGKLTEEEARSLIKRNTRRFAKRQMTWFRRDRRITWIHIGENDKKEKAVREILRYIT